MRKLTCENGTQCGAVNALCLDGQTWAIAVSWKKGVDGLPDEQTFNEAIETSIKECKEAGALHMDSRVITANEGVDEGLATARATLHRDALVARGFTRGEDRVEYYMDLADALAAFDARKSATELVWRCVDADSEPDLTRAAELFRLASEGDPASHADEDRLGFLRVLIEDEEIIQAAERLQIGMCGNDPAAVLALRVYPSDGWSSIYYLGVLPAFRGRGFGAAAMHQGLRSLKAMGGKIYHDGTGSSNVAARALFARLGRPPFRVMEEWVLRARR
jgi:ribosomal protein S18 acetylase RimI-like enzyme